MYCIGVGSPEILKNADICIQGFQEMSLDRIEQI